MKFKLPKQTRRDFMAISRQYNIPFSQLVKQAKQEILRRRQALFNELLFHTYGPRWGAIVVNLNSFVRKQPESKGAIAFVGF